MSVYLHGRHYWYEFQLGGRRVRGNTHTDDLKKAKESELVAREQVRRQVVYGDPAPRPKTTFDQLLVRYVNEVVAGKRHLLDRSRAETARALEHLRAAIGGSTPLSDITTGRISEWVGTMNKADLAPATINRRVAVLRAMLRRAVAWGLIDAVPHYDRQAVEQTIDRVLTDDEEQRLLAACGPTDLRDFVTFLLDTGARRAEALSITWEDVRLDQSRPDVLLRTRKTKGRHPVRPVPLTKRLLEILKHRKAGGAARPWPWDVDGDAEGQRKGSGGGGRAIAKPDAVDRRGCYARKLADGSEVWDVRFKCAGKLRTIGLGYKSLDAAREARDAVVPPSALARRCGLRAAFERALLEAGVTHFRMHDCRHTFASRLVRKGVSLHVVGKLLGHSNPIMTARYAHLAHEQLVAAITVLDAAPSKKRARHSPARQEKRRIGSSVAAPAPTD